MSQQEAASFGPFEPASPQHQSSVTVEPDQGTPFAQANEPLGPAVPDYQAEEAAAESRSRRRRAWTVIALALIIPAGAAAALALILTGGSEDSGPTDTITRVTTTTETAAVQTSTAAAAVTQTAAANTAAAPAAQNTAAAAAGAAAAEAAQTTQAAAAETAEATSATAQSTASLSPEARLAAWPEIERIEIVTGETLWLLAQQYDTTVSAIMLLNGISDASLLPVGQLVSIPVGFNEEVSLAAPEVESSAPSSDPAPAAAASSSGSVSYQTAVTLTPAAGAPADLAGWGHIIQIVIVAGDSLDAIANANGTTVEAIQALNGLNNPNLIFEGQEILVPVGYDAAVDLAPAPAAAPAADTEAAPAAAPPATDTSNAAVSDDMLETESPETAAGDDMLETETPSSEGAADSAPGDDNEDMLEE